MELVTPHSIIGIDVSKDTLDVATSTDNRVRPYANTASGFARLIVSLRECTDPLIVLEATGEYHIPLVEALEAAGYLTAICNPAWVRNFAKSQGASVKTDKVDARMLVAYGRARNPERRPLLPPLLREIKALLARRDDLVGMRTMERNRIKGTHDDSVRASAMRMEAVMTAEITMLGSEIARLIASDPAMAAQYRQLCSTPGIAMVCAAQILVSLPELGTLSPKQLAALVGVAPYARDSGKKRGKRFVQGGRAALRKALYQAVFVAIYTVKHDHALKGHYRRLRAAGKAHDLAMVATMRHLVIYLNVMVRDGLSWNELDVNQVQKAA